MLFALNRRHLINEKGAPAKAAEFPCTTSSLSDRAAHVWAAIGDAKLAIALSELRAPERAAGAGGDSALDRFQTADHQSRQRGGSLMIRCLLCGLASAQSIS